MPSLRTGRPRHLAMEPSPRPVRTAEVLYLLSRGAHLEHPHMIHVSFAAPHPGPTLRDVKARLVAVRGRGMPDSFSWSYKRIYKDTFIWCDLFDDDLILPLAGSDEYVLKAVKLFDVASQGGELASPSSRRESEVSMALKKSLLLMNVPQAESCMDLNSQGAPEVCSFVISDVSSSSAFEDTAGGGKTRQCASGERTNSSSPPGSSSPPSPNRENQRDAASNGDVTTEPATAMASKRDETTSVSSHPESEGCVRRGARAKESAIHDVDELPGAAVEGTSSGVAGPDDAFLYGVLRKATKLGSSFRPRLCRGVDVVDSTQTKPRRSSAKEEGRVTQLSSSSPPRYTSPKKELSEHFDTDERATSTPVDKLINEEPPDLPRRPGPLDASHRKPMRVLAKLPSSRGASRVHTVPQSGRSESKGNKLEPSKVRSGSKSSCERDGFLHHSCSRQGPDDSVIVDESAMASKQRRPPVKKATIGSAETSTARAKATVKAPHEKAMTASRNGSKESTSKLQVDVVEDATKPERLESFTSESRTGNKQGLKMATQIEVTEATSNEAAKRWSLEPPPRPRDFKSREDRPLTSMDWEKSFQEACRHSEPPTNLVLHECSRCGRTFKLESLQVHMRGCRAVTKAAKPSMRGRVSR